VNERYLFRGKLLDNGEWVQGYYVGAVGYGDCDEICNINLVSGHRVEIDPDTVGQCTGLRDKRGKLIFEGDIANIEYTEIDGEVCFAHEVVTWRDGGWVLLDVNTDSYCVLDGKDNEILEVIGNIHDNPELLDGLPHRRNIQY